MRRILAFVLCFLAGPVSAGDIRVAVASNFKPALEKLAPEFTQASGHGLIVSAGATGLLFAQISQGAPFDVFLAADRARPQALIDKGLALGDTPQRYAVGRLVLIFQAKLPPGDPPDLSSIATLSLANPRTAPYGRAAEQALTRLNTAPTLRRAIAGNIAGVNAALKTGAVDAGFAARAMIPDAEQARGWLVPKSWHDPIEQTAVALRRATDPAAAQAFLNWLTSPATQARIKSLGYDVD